MNKLWLWVLIGVLTLISGVLEFPNGGVYFGVETSWVSGAVSLILGPVIILLAIRGMMRGEGKPRGPYTEQDAERAKEELGKMYKTDFGKDPVPAVRRKISGSSRRLKNGMIVSQRKNNAMHGLPCY